MTGKRHSVSVGDKVRIVRSRFIKRVGYPLHYSDLTLDFAKHPKLDEALETLGVTINGVDGSWKAKLEAAEGLAKAAVRMRAFGGNERRIHYYKTAEFDCPLWGLGEDTLPDFTGSEATVFRTRTRVTGEYLSADGWGEDGEEVSGQPGELTNRKRHLILTTEYGDIEACDVEKLEAAE